MTGTRTAQSHARRRVRADPRTWVPAVVAVLAFVAAGCASGADAPTGIPPTATSVAAEQPAENLSGPGLTLFDLETGQATRLTGLFAGTPSIAVSPDGTMVSYQGIDEDGAGVIYVTNVDGTNIRALEETATTEGIPIGPQFSPDGSQIVYQRNAGGTLVGDLFIVDVATGQATQLTHLKPFSSGLWFMNPTFSPDGERVLFTRADVDYSYRLSNFSNPSWDVWSVPATGGRPSLVLREAIGGGLSPDGRTIVYFTHPPGNPFEGDMWLAYADGTDPRRLATGALQTLSAEWSPDGTKIAYAESGEHGEGGRGATYIVDVTTGETSKVLDGAYFAEWVDGHTLIIGPGTDD